MRKKVVTYLAIGGIAVGIIAAAALVMSGVVVLPDVASMPWGGVRP